MLGSSTSKNSFTNPRAGAAELKIIKLHDFIKRQRHENIPRNPHSYVTGVYMNGKVACYKHTSELS